MKVLNFVLFILFFARCFGSRLVLEIWVGPSEHSLCRLCCSFFLVYTVSFERYVMYYRYCVIVHFCLCTVFHLHLYLYLYCICIYIVLVFVFAFVFVLCMCLFSFWCFVILVVVFIL